MWNAGPCLVGFYDMWMPPCPMAIVGNRCDKQELQWPYSKLLEIQSSYQSWLSVMKRNNLSLQRGFEQGFHVKNMRSFRALGRLNCYLSDFILKWLTTSGDSKMPIKVAVQLILVLREEWEMKYIGLQNFSSSWPTEHVIFGFPASKIQAGTRNWLQRSISLWGDFRFKPIS